VQDHTLRPQEFIKAPGQGFPGKDDLIASAGCRDAEKNQSVSSLFIFPGKVDLLDEENAVSPGKRLGYQPAFIKQALHNDVRAWWPAIRLRQLPVPSGLMIKHT